jgi:hypothetical protein
MTFPTGFLVDLRNRRKLGELRWPKIRLGQQVLDGMHTYARSIAITYLVAFGLDHDLPSRQDHDNRDPD